MSDGLRNFIEMPYAELEERNLSGEGSTQAPRAGGSKSAKSG